MSRITIPEPTKPEPLEGYWSPKDAKKILAWDYISRRMSEAPNYWIATVNPNGRPHVVPVWGVWLDETLYFGGGPHTRWSRNLLRHPYVTVHLDDSNHAVILEGSVTRIADPDSGDLRRIDDVYEQKYNMRHGPPIWHLHLHKVLAWNSMDTATRWLFEENV